jgi:spore coat protein U-like protein
MPRKDQILRKSVILAAGFAALAAAPLSAQNLTYPMNAQVAPVCGVYSSAGTVIDVDFGSLATVDTAATVNAPAGSATYRCNSRAGFTRTIASQNNGWLTLDGTPTTQDTRRIRFTLTHGGGSGLGFAARQLTAPVNNSFPGNTTWLAGQTGGVSFQASGVRGAPAANGVPGTTVLSGNYRDTVTITLTAN